MVGYSMSTKLIDITKQLKSFLPSDTDSALLRETNGLTGDSIIVVHVQKRWIDFDNYTTTFFPDTPVNDKTNCLNIVNVGVAEKNRRKGLFTDFLELLEGFDYDPYFRKTFPLYVRVENVMNPVLDACLPRKGYSPAKGVNDTCYSYSKRIRDAGALEKQNMPGDQLLSIDPQFDWSRLLPSP
jgi:hypothetical protein